MFNLLIMYLQYTGIPTIPRKLCNEAEKKGQLQVNPTLAQKKAAPHQQAAASKNPATATTMATIKKVCVVNLPLLAAKSHMHFLHS